MVSSMVAGKLTLNRKGNQKEHGFYHVLFLVVIYQNPYLLCRKKLDERK